MHHHPENWAPCSVCPIMLDNAMPLTCEEDGEEEDEQEVLASLAHFEPAATLLAASSPRRPAAYFTHTHSDF